ncbi:hypothetical protein B9Z55_011250 [Caenorhabditis nigoni]|uniref:Sdz-33 F-box domain-containing protein n=1 Tax=Caenorhabditis nigoni TaxID=1611254 RepID=A0A2G5UJ83_9PELO|nr:hypothetical protein B9Z55_011250 [Caenorhabditis nigoni]
MRAFAVWVTMRPYSVRREPTVLPNLKSIEINCYKPEPNEYDIQSVQNILRAFLPYVESIRLLRVPLQENFSIQHIGMANLKEFEIDCPRHQKFDDLLTLNVERCTIFKDHFSLRHLNRFFKLWMKGSNRKLKYLLIHGVNIADWNVLLKGLQPEEARRFQAEDDESVKEYIIQNSYGTCGRIKMYNNQSVYAPPGLNLLASGYSACNLTEKCIPNSENWNLYL